MPTAPRISVAQRVRTSLPSALRSPTARALAAIGCSAAVLTVWALPPAAGASATVSPDRIIKHSLTFNPTPSLTKIFPSGPGQPSNPGHPVGPTTHTAAHASKTAANGGGYVSTFSPAAVLQTPDPTSSAACLANGQPVSGPAGDLDLPGIAGTSTDPGHTGALKITGFGPQSMLPPGIDSTDLTELQITRTVDKASPNLAMVASSGYRFACAHVEVGSGDGYSSAEFALLNAGLVADDQTGNVETLTVTYSSILWSYTEPGSVIVHTGSGKINARPDKMHANIATDSRFIAEGTIGLTALVALGLIALYVIGRKRHRKRYRSRYYRRMSARARQAEYVEYQEYMHYQQQLAAEQMAAEEPAAQQAQMAEPEPEPELAPTPEPAREAEVEVDSEADSEVVPEPELEPESVSEPEEPEVEPELEPEPESESEIEPAAEAATDAEAEPEAVEAEPEAEAAAESEPESEPAAESEDETEPAAEADSAPEPASEPEPEPEAEPEPASEPELEAEPAAETEPEPEAETEAETEPETEHAAEAESEPVLEAASEPESEADGAVSEESEETRAKDAATEVTTDEADDEDKAAETVGKPSAVASSRSS